MLVSPEIVIVNPVYDHVVPLGLYRSITVAVTVLDFNDNPPVITNSPLTNDETVLEVLH